VKSKIIEREDLGNEREALDLAAPAVQTGTDDRALKSAKSGKSGKSLSRIVVELAVLLPLTIFGLECLLSAAGVGQQEILQPDPELGCVHIPGKKVTWRLEGFSRDAFSSAGLRDGEHLLNKPKGCYRIALLGDSATEGLQVDMAQTFSRQLDGALAKTFSKKGVSYFEAMNFGCSSYSTGQELLQFKKQVAQYKPDLTIVLLCYGDTLENTLDLSNRAHAEPKPYFYIDAQGKLAQDSSVLLASADKLVPNPLVDFLRSKSCLYGVWTQLNFNWNLTDKLYFRSMRFFQEVGRRMQGKARAIEAPVYAQQDKLKVTQALVTAFNDTAKENGGKFALMLFPDVAAREAGWQYDMRQLKAQGAAEHFDVIDLNPPFRSHWNPSSLFLQYHFSKEGHALVADTLTQYVKSTLADR